MLFVYALGHLKFDCFATIELFLSLYPASKKRRGVRFIFGIRGVYSIYIEINDVD